MFSIAWSNDYESYLVVLKQSRYFPKSFFLIYSLVLDKPSVSLIFLSLFSQAYTLFLVLSDFHPTRQEYRPNVSSP